MKKRHLVLALLIALSGVTYLDRICIAVAGPRMQDDMHLSPSQWGWVLNAFVLAYGLFEIPSGALGDRIGHRRVLTRIVVWWSVFTSLTGVAWNYVSLVVTRFLFGAGEAGAFPNMSGSMGRWFPATERGQAQGLVWGASRVGGALSSWTVVPLIALLGWRHTFFVLGVLGLVWAVFWFTWYRDRPGQQPGITAAELAEIGAGTEPVAHVAVPWGRLFRQPQLWLIMVTFSCYVWGSMFYLTWFPTYLVKGRGLTMTEMGAYAALPFILGAVGNVLGGRASDRLSARFGVARGRRLVGVTCLAVSALFLVGVALTRGKITGVVLLALGFGVMDGMLPAIWAICLDVGGRHAGAVTGAMNTAGQVGGFLCTAMVGYLVEASGDYAPAIFVIAGMVMLSAFLFSRIDASRPLLVDTPVQSPAPTCV